jgi:hypothetical protein
MLFPYPKIEYTPWIAPLIPCASCQTGDRLRGHRRHGQRLCSVAAATGAELSTTAREPNRSELTGTACKTNWPPSDPAPDRSPSTIPESLDAPPTFLCGATRKVAFVSMGVGVCAMSLNVAHRERPKYIGEHMMPISSYNICLTFVPGKLVVQIGRV